MARVRLCLSFYYLFKLAENVRLAKEKELVFTNLDLGAAIFREQDLIANLEQRGVHGTRDIFFTRTNGNDTAFVGILGLVGWQKDTGGGLRLFGRPSHQDAIAQRGQGAA